MRAHVGSGPEDFWTRVLQGTVLCVLYISTRISSVLLAGLVALSPSFTIWVTVI